MEEDEDMKREESKQTASDVLLKRVTAQETFPRTEVQQFLRSFDDGKTTVHFLRLFTQKRLVSRPCVDARLCILLLCSSTRYSRLNRAYFSRRFH